MKPGAKNSICDIDGLRVGNAHNPKLKSGVTVLIADQPVIASVKVLGGGPGTRDTELLNPENSVEKIDAITLSGGSAFGLDAGSGVQAWLREQGRGYEVGPARVPIVPGAILFDLLNGGDKDWGRFPPYRELAYEAAASAAGDFEIGSAGAGYGALVTGLKGGLGTASVTTENGITVAALFAVNAVGSATMGTTGHFWAAPFEHGSEFGGLGLPQTAEQRFDEIRLKFRDSLPGPANTTIGIVATDANLTKAQAERLATSAHGGIARAIWPAHTPMDGDLVFALATGAAKSSPDAIEIADLGAHAAAVTARAIARGIYAARRHAGDIFPAWHDIFARP